MKNSPLLKLTHPIQTAALLLCATLLPLNAVGGLMVSDFTLPKHTNNTQSVRLSDYAGSIIVVEFFYWWCPHCQIATPDLKRNIHDYYLARHGNPAGIPVVNLYINLSQYGSETDDFIRDNRLDIVADDVDCSTCDFGGGFQDQCFCRVYDQLQGDGTPHIVVINGSTNSAAFQQWEVAYIHSGYTVGKTVPELRRVIDGIGEKVPPTVRIQYPTTGLRVTNETITARGTAADNVGVSRVVYLVDNRSGTGPTFQALTTNNWTNWTAPLVLVPGLNTLAVKAIDAETNSSKVMTTDFFYVVKSRFTLTTNGHGRVAPNLSGQMLEVGRLYALQATPDRGHVFSNWTGGITSLFPRVLFVMETNLTAQANFVTSPFLPLKGTFNGLFAPPEGVLHANSGSMNFTLSEGGTFSGQLQLAGKRFPFTGFFFADGTSTNAVKRAGTNDLILEMALDLAGGTEQVTGRVVNTNAVAGWIAELLADRAPVYAGTNKSPYFGKYTATVHENHALPEVPIGEGIGSVNVAANGRLTFSGMLADGSPVTQSVPISKEGSWPFYVPLYAGKGLLWSRVTLSNNAAPAASLAGPATWIKPPLPATKFYTNGFHFDTTVEGSVYHPTNKLLDFDLGWFTFGGGNLVPAVSNLVSLLPNNKLTNHTTVQPLTLTFTLPTGLYNGMVTVTNGGRRRVVPFKGAVLQRQNYGTGFFLGTNQTGHALFATNVCSCTAE